MLDRLQILNASFHDVENKKWNIEEKLLQLEEAISILEKVYTKLLNKEQKPDCLDFKVYVIPELERRIIHLEKLAAKSIPGVECNQDFLSALQKAKAELSQHKKTYEALEKNIESLQEQIKENCKAMRQLIPALRAHINTITDKKKKLDVITSLHPLVSVKILLTIFDEMRELNARLLFSAMLRITGIAFDKYYSGKNFNYICHKHFGVNIEDIFEHFIKTHETKDINAGNMQNTLQGITAAVAKALYKNNSVQDANICALIEMEVYLSLAVKFYQFTDDLQMDAGLTRKRFALWMNLKEILNPYMIVSNAAHSIVIAPEFESAFAEAVIWLQGIYKHGYDEIPPFLKSADGVVTELGQAYITDEEGRSLFRWKHPLTRLKLGDGHKHHAAALFRQPAPVAKEHVQEDRKNQP